MPKCGGFCESPNGAVQNSPGCSEAEPWVIDAIQYLPSPAWRDGMNCAVLPCCEEFALHFQRNQNPRGV